MGGAIGAIVQVAMPLIQNVLGSLTKMMGSMGSMGDMFKGLSSMGQPDADSNSAKSSNSNDAAEQARDKAQAWFSHQHFEPRPFFHV